ncbi:MAG: carbohydrate ABC transporter substrate-binding protein [Firmicutes bacterium]|nr:carbohydrate ABC transporter substrate-binding protein [Bacillota bacterium]
MKKRLAGIFLAGIIALNLAACASNTQTGKKNEKTTVSTLYYSTLPEFEKLVESTFDDIDLEIEPSSLSTYNSDTLRRLRNDHGKDLIFTSMLNSAISDYMLDLSANSFTTNFASSVMDIIQQDGKTMWLPMPSVCKGLIINKTLVKDLGKELPKNQQELKELMSAAKTSGKGADDEGFVFAAADIDGISAGEFIISTIVPDFLGTMEGERWTNDFINKKADAKGTLEEPLSFFISLASEGYMDPSCLHLGINQKNAIPVIERMASRKMTICYGYSDILQKIRKANTQDEFVMIPFLSGSGNASWVTATPASYLGANAAITKDKTKLDAVLRVLELFSSPEGQSAILKDTKSDTSYLMEAVEGSGGTNSGLESYEKSGYVYNMNRFSSDIRWLLGSNIVKVCTGDMEMSDALASIDNLNKNGTTNYAEDHTLIGSVDSDMLYENYNTRREETSIGNLYRRFNGRICRSRYCICKRRRHKGFPL